MDMVAGDPQDQDFRAFLQDELEKRCKKNPRFSLRAFARTLEVEPSALSKILHGKRALTPKMLLRMASQLGLPEQDIERFSNKQNNERGSPLEKIGSGAQKSTQKIILHKKVSLALTSKQLQEADQLLTKFLAELNDLAASGVSSPDTNDFSFDVVLRSEQKKMDPPRPE